MRALDGKTAGSLVKLVIFFVVTSIATAGLAITIGNVGLGDSNEYKAIFTDATGVEKGDDIRIAGVQVGEVKGMKVLGDGWRAVAEVTFSVDKDQKLARRTQAAIRFRNLVGQRYISLSEGAGSPDQLAGGATIPLTQTQPAFDLTVLFNGFKPLFAALSPQDVNQLAY